MTRAKPQASITTTTTTTAPLLALLLKYMLLSTNILHQSVIHSIFHATNQTANRTTNTKLIVNNVKDCMCKHTHCTGLKQYAHKPMDRQLHGEADSTHVVYCLQGVLIVRFIVGFLVVFVFVVDDDHPS